jgi:hypothetical protein
MTGSLVSVVLALAQLWGLRPAVYRELVPERLPERQTQGDVGFDYDDVRCSMANVRSLFTETIEAVGTSLASGNRVSANHRHYTREVLKNSLVVIPANAGIQSNQGAGPRPSPG